MQRPTTCSTCRGKYKKGKPVTGEPKFGSRYFQCQTCWRVLEQTAEGYEFVDQGAPPERIRREVAQREREEKEREELVRSWGLPRRDRPAAKPRPLF